MQVERTPEPVEWARESSRPGTRVFRLVESGLRLVDAGMSLKRIDHMTSGRDDAVTPTATAVILCAFETVEGESRWAVKFYEHSVDGARKLARHASILRGLAGRLPVPGIIRVFESGDVFGLPVLITTAEGYTLCAKSETASAENLRRWVESLADALSSLHAVEPASLGLEIRDEAAMASEAGQMFRDDAVWYAKHASAVGQEFRGILREGVEILSSVEPACDRACICHRDLTAYNAIIHDGRVHAIIDWDHCGVAAASEDVAKAMLGLMVTLKRPWGSRAPLVSRFLKRYSDNTGLDLSTLIVNAVPYFLDAGMDWLVGVKNAPAEELAGALRFALDLRVSG